MGVVYYFCLTCFLKRERENERAIYKCIGAVLYILNILQANLDRYTRLQDCFMANIYVVVRMPLDISVKGCHRYYKNTE